MPATDMSFDAILARYVDTNIPLCAPPYNREFLLSTTSRELAAVPGIEDMAFYILVSYAKPKPSTSLYRRRRPFRRNFEAP